MAVEDVVVAAFRKKHADGSHTEALIHRIADGTHQKFGTETILLIHREGFRIARADQNTAVLPAFVVHRIQIRNKRVTEAQVIAHDGAIRLFQRPRFLVHEQAVGRMDAVDR